MYCINCGVKLEDTEKKCPLCNTAVYHPDIKRQEGVALYPSNRYPQEELSPTLVLIIVSVLFTLPMIITAVCNLHFDKTISWSGYVIGALLLSYFSFVMPLWFKRPNPVVFVPVSFTIAGGYLAYINYATGGHWFLSFAMPVCIVLGLILTTIVTLLRYVKRGKLYIFGGAFLALGIFAYPLEILINITFNISTFVAWFVYPLIVLGVLGGLLIFLGICRPARKNMEKTFFM